jgi:hypothetical protein
MSGRHHREFPSGSRIKPWQLVDEIKRTFTDGNSTAFYWLSGAGA